MRWGWLALTVLIGGASASAQEALPAEPAQAESTGSDAGSLWSDGGYQSFLSPDRKARTIGDLVTVKIVEASQASRSATTSLDRQSSLSAGISAMVGLETSVAKASPNIKPSALLGASTGNTFKGDGATTSSGSLTATITARVVKVLPNGNLLILGQQEVKINHEVQVLTIRGIVRPQDIQINNVVLSTFVADARIEYAGNGVVDEKQRPGWLSRTVDRVWPF
jgi:flagellar L-ring protein precursor FlgH